MLLQLGLARLAWLIGYLLSLLLWQDHQRAEYLTDVLGAEISGTGAMVSCLEKFHLEGAFRFTLQQFAIDRNADRRDFFAELLEAATQTPAREVERVKRVWQIELSRLDATHPPTAYRIQLLQSRPASTGSVLFSPEEEAQLEAELSRLKNYVQHNLVNWKRSHLNDQV